MPAFLALPTRNLAGFAFAASAAMFSPSGSLEAAGFETAPFLDDLTNLMAVALRGFKRANALPQSGLPRKSGQTEMEEIAADPAGLERGQKILLCFPDQAVGDEPVSLGLESGP